MTATFFQPGALGGDSTDLPPGFWFACVGISLVIHLTALGFLVFAPFGQASQNRIDLSKAIEVDLVGFNPELPLPPAQASSNEPAAPAAEPEVPKEPAASDAPAVAEKTEAQPIPVKKSVEKKVAADYDLVKPAPAVKTSLKKKTFDAEKVIQGAVRRVSEESARSRPKSLKDRIAAMEKQVENLAYKGRISDGQAARGGAGTNSDFGPMEVYQAEVAVKMKRNWAFSSDLAGGAKGLEARLVIKIMPDGTITDVWYEKRSGNTYLDESAYKTVMKANPLPPLPEGYPHYHLVLGFTPRGLAS